MTNKNMKQNILTKKTKKMNQMGLKKLLLIIYNLVIKNMKLHLKKILINSLRKINQKSYKHMIFKTTLKMNINSLLLIKN